MSATARILKFERPPAGVSRRMVTKVADMTDVSDKMLADAANWYRQVHVPAAFRDMDPQLLRVVSKRCGNDWHRVVRMDDRTLVIYNRAVW
jgi:hypothetical protein